MSTPASAMPPIDGRSPESVTTVVSGGGYFERHLGTSLQHLLAPLDGTHPAGLPVRGTMVFRMVEQARRSDDATLPMGSWAVEPKRANWPKVSSLIVDILTGTAKDLQLASWLLEAEIQQRGFTAIAPCIALMQGLCECTWADLHPQGDNGDYESRANIVRWVNEKLLATLSLVPLVTHGEHAASWSHWEVAHHYERIRAAKGDLPEEAQQATTLDELHALLAVVPTDDLRDKYAELAEARAAIHAFEESLRVRLAEEAPSLGQLDGLLARVQAPLRSEVARRGQSLLPPVMAATEEATPEVATTATDGETAFEPAYGEPRHNLLADRDSAYRELSEIAGFLMRIEPHSPVPYLICRAIEWGSLDASELYHEVFQKLGGQIHIFDLLGLEPIQQDREAGQGDA